jgi:hypothetical protein
MVLAGCLVFGGVAQARLYRCNFDSHQSQMTISTKTRKIKVLDSSGDVEFSIRKIKQVTLLGETRQIFILDNGTDVQVALSTPYKDIATGFYYPFKVSRNGVLGGCESEDLDLDSSISRRKSLVNALGSSIVNSWSGDLAAFRGYRVTNSVTLAAGSTWIDLQAKARDLRSCSLNRGAYFVPSVSRKGQSFVHLDYPSLMVANKGSGLREDDFTFKKGEEIINLSADSEGLCLVEKEGVPYDVNCQILNKRLFTNVSAKVNLSSDFSFNNGVAPKGDYVYALCSEGHSTWIPSQLMKEDKQHFDPVSVGPN